MLEYREVNTLSDSRPRLDVYCDESCHLPADGQKVMLLGAVWCPHAETRRLSEELRALKEKHRATGELKWTKVSKSRDAFYRDLVDWYLAEPNLHFRALVVSDKSLLDHDAFNQGSHDLFYYKMYFSLLSKILNPQLSYNIYLDIKDTRSRNRVRQLRDVLCNNVFDFTSEMIHHIQNVHSWESELLQVADFILGAVAYSQRGLSGNTAKEEVARRLAVGVNHDLLHSTPLCETKLNIFVFTPRES